MLPLRVHSVGFQVTAATDTMARLTNVVHLPVFIWYLMIDIYPLDIFTIYEQTIRWEYSGSLHGFMFSVSKALA